MDISIKEEIELYISDPSMRIKERIPDNFAIVEDIKQLFIQQVQNKIDSSIVKKFLCLLAEEQLRRYNIKLEEDKETDDLDTYIAQILDIDLEKYVYQYVQKIEEQYLDEKTIDMETYFENKIKLMLKISTVDIPNYNYNFDKLSMHAKKLFIIYKVAFYKLILPLLKSFSFISNQEIDFSSLKSLGITNNEQFMTLIIQNRINSCDKKMKISINNNEYVDYLNESREYLQNTINSIIKKSREYEIDIITDKISTYNNDKVIQLFIKTNNMNIAAGILKGLSHSHPLFVKIIDTLKTEKCVNPVRKLHMLKNGTYLNILLICDSNGYIQKWLPNKINLYKLIDNMNEISKVMWVKLFPKYEAHISNIFYRKKQI